MEDVSILGPMGKKAVVVGGTHGIGLATARALVDAGAGVVVTGRESPRLEAAARELGGAAVAVSTDLRHLSDLDALTARVEAHFRRFDFLFVNAGVSALEPFETVTEGSYDATFDVNAKGLFFATQRLSRLMSDGGAIVLTTSIANDSGYPGMLVYAGSKAAVRSFMQGFAAELLPRRIRVNAVTPGFIRTPTMGVTDATPEARAAFEAEGRITTPMGRLGTPEEVARAVLFLAFEATFTTGVELAVDGGLGQRITAPLRSESESCTGVRSSTTEASTAGARTRWAPSEIPPSVTPFEPHRRLYPASSEPHTLPWGTFTRA